MEDEFDIFEIVETNSLVGEYSFSDDLGSIREFYFSQAVTGPIPPRSLATHHPSPTISRMSIARQIERAREGLVQRAAVLLNPIDFVNLREASCSDERWLKPKSGASNDWRLVAFSEQPFAHFYIGNIPLRTVMVLIQPIKIFLVNGCYAFSRNMQNYDLRRYLA